MVQRRQCLGLLLEAPQPILVAHKIFWEHFDCYTGGDSILVERGADHVPTLVISFPPPRRDGTRGDRLCRRSSLRQAPPSPMVRAKCLRDRVALIASRVCAGRWPSPAVRPG